MSEETVEPHSQLTIQLFGTVVESGALASIFQYRCEGCLDCIAAVLAYEADRDPKLAEVINKAADIQNKKLGRR